MASDTETLLAAGWRLHSQGKSLQGLAQIHRAIAADPRNPKGYCLRGLVWLSAQKYQWATNDFSLALQLEPDSATILANRAFARCNQGDLKGAYADANQAVRLEPNNAEANLARGMALVAARHIARGVTDIERAVELAPNSVVAYRILVIAHQANGDPQAAQTALRHAVELEMVSKQARGTKPIPTSSA